MVVYHRVQVLIGRPYWISDRHKQHYQGKEARKLALEVTEYCHQQIVDLLTQGRSIKKK
jgi:hypothetical protein